MHLLTEHAAARRLAITINRLKTLVREGQITYIEIGAEIRFDPQDLAAFIESRKSRRRGESLAPASA